MEKQILDWSMISAYAYCPERYHLSHVLNWAPSRAATSLAFGGGMHKGLAPIAKRAYGGRTIEIPETALKEAIRCFTTEYIPFDGMDEVRTLEKGEELLKAYVQQDRENGWSGVQTEISFALDLSPTLTVCGKIDKFGLNDGNKAIQDWKTSTQPWQFIANPNHQATMYLLGAQTLLGPEVQDFYFELIGVFKNSEAGYRTIRAKGSEPSRTESVFQAIHIQRSPRQMEQFIGELRMWEFHIADCRESGCWPMNTENCNGKYGLCPFQTACMAGDGKQAMLEAMYVKVKWNPITATEVKL